MIPPVATRPLLVGQALSATGSRCFGRLLAAGDAAPIADIARRQVAAGAGALDVCLAVPGRAERADLERVLPWLADAVAVPLLVDSVDPEILASALALVPGRVVLNSLNLRDGGASCRRLGLLARRHGVTVVASAVDERGPAIGCQDKVGVALRLHHLLTAECGLPPERVLLDPLTFPCAAPGRPELRGGAQATIDAVAELTALLPASATILGISNVSWGQPAAGRAPLNAVFLAAATAAGLGAAIVDVERIGNAPSTDGDRMLATRLLFATDDQPVADFHTRFSTRDREPVAARSMP